MVNDWDLQAVVRGCSSMSSSSTTTATTSSTTSLIADFQSNFTNISPFYTQQLQDQIFSTLTNPTRSRTNLVGELHELYRPFFPKSDQPTLSLSPQSTTPTSSLSSISAFIEQKKSTKQHKQQQENHTKHSHVPSVINLRSKKRKNQLKRICQVPAENVSLDIWSWRKYGQKPIKGSPYPRGYYKCSSSKGCLARKQVEMNRSNPTMFTVTYTADHNHSAPTHRNSLAGSTRQKSVTDGDSIKSTTKSLSPATSLEENLVLPESTDIEEKLENLLGDEEEEDEHGFSDMTVSDDFFMGLEGLVVPATKDYFSDH